jgi:uncharacterized protein (DUF736 family)
MLRILHSFYVAIGAGWGRIDSGGRSMVSVVGKSTLQALFASDA